MSTEGIIATIATILIFVVIGIVLTLLKRKGIVKTYNVPSSSHDDYMKLTASQLAAPGHDSASTPMGVRPPG